MKRILTVLIGIILLLSSGTATMAQEAPAKNIVIFLMDGYRWRELYQGADSAILFNKKYNNKDSAGTFTRFWGKTIEERRKKLMPFVWNTVASQGQLLGNRDLGNLVNVKNKYWFSYPGRSEVFTGYYDSAVNSNDYPDNPNTNVLEYIDQQPGFHGKVVSFSSWDAVARILNRNRNHMLVNIIGEDITGDALTQSEKEANFGQRLLPGIFGPGERFDAATYALAKAYLVASHPRVLYIDLGENDEFGHAGDYDDYLDAAHYADAMFSDIWTTLQSDPFYKNQTDLLVFPDHGRGIGPAWTSHGSRIPHSDETYLIALGPGIPAKGEVGTAAQVYQQQYAQTIAALLGLHFTATHPVNPPIQELLK